jgi:hypothetical protein
MKRHLRRVSVAARRHAVDLVLAGVVSIYVVALGVFA